MQARIPYIDRIWRVTSSVELEAPLSVREAYERLAPLFDTAGTVVTVEGDALSYSKKNPAAQDKLATFTSGALLVEEGEGKTRLHYDVGSTALFLCFLAPLVFLAFGQFTVLVNELEKPAVIKQMAEKEKEKEEEKAAGKTVQLHWIDQMLGAPAPKKPGEEDEDEKARKQARGEPGEDEEELDYNHSPKTSYAFAGIFLAIYLVGRVLEPYLLKRTFRAALNGPSHGSLPGSSPGLSHGQQAAEISESTEEKEAATKLAPPEGGNPKT